jgi:hypothetical protein
MAAASEAATHVAAATSEAATHVAATTREAAAHMAASAAEAATMAASAAEAAAMTASATSTMTASAPATPASPGVSRQGRRSKGRGPDGDRCNQHDCSMQCDSLHSDSPFHSLVEPAYAMQSAQTMMVGNLGAPPAVVVPLLPALTDNCDIRCFRRRGGASPRMYFNMHFKKTGRLRAGAGRKSSCAARNAAQMPSGPWAGAHAAPLVEHEQMRVAHPTGGLSLRQCLLRFAYLRPRYEPPT